MGTLLKPSFLCSSRIFIYSLWISVSKTNLAVHEDKQRVPFVKVRKSREGTMASCR